MSRLASRAAVPVLAAIALTTFSFARPALADTTTSAPGSTSTTIADTPTTTAADASTTTEPGQTTTTSLPGDGLPPDDLGPTATPPADLPPVQLNPGDADGGGTAVNPADLIAPPGTPAPSTLPQPAGIPAGLAAGLVSQRGVERRLTEAIAALDTAQAQVTVVQAVVSTAQTGLDEANTDLDAMSGPQQAAAKQASATHARVRRLADAALATDNDGEQMIAIVDSKDPSMARARITTLESIGHEAAISAKKWAKENRALTSQSKAAAAVVSAATQNLTESDSRLTAAQAVVTAATQSVTDAQIAAGVGPQVVPGIPNRVLAAYVRAAQWESTQDPACQMTWWALAAIGRVESGNASHEAVSADGEIVPPIIGIPLNGQNGTALILDTDHGLLDGDTTYDNAVGPMQFIPSTWRSDGIDATGDHIADPNNIYDAAFTAARYLCAGAGGQSVDTEAGMDAAAFSYNHSAAYVAAVWNGSATYRLIAAGPTAPN